MSRALIVGDGWESRNVLAAVKGLAAAGWEVGVAAPEPALAFSSRHVRFRHAIPPLTRQFDRFAEALESIVEQARYEIVFGGGDAETLAIVALADRLATCVPYAPFLDVTRAFDKLELARAAEAVGLGSPRTELATSRSVETTPLPVVLKARLHWTPGAAAAPDRLEAALVADRTELGERCAAIRAAGGQPVLQEPILGDAIAYVALVDRDGSVVSEFQQRGGGTWPVEAGVWTRLETVPLDLEFAAACHRLLRELRWFGLVQLQFLVPADGNPRLIDFNGRFYASLRTPLAGGLNVPAVWADLALGRPTSAPATIPVGLRYQWLVGDLLRAQEERRGGLIADIADTLRYRIGSIHSVWDPADPMPAFRYALRLIGSRVFGRAFAPAPPTPRSGPAWVRDEDEDPEDFGPSW